LIRLARLAPSQPWSWNRSSRAAALVFALLVLATVAAFAWAQRVKRDPLVLDKVTFVGTPNPHPKHPVHSFTPNGDCRFDLMRIRFRTTQSDQGTVQVVTPGVIKLHEAPPPKPNVHCTISVPRRTASPNGSGAP
jgi:hypothetical protein